MSAPASDVARRLRLNVSAKLGDEITSKFLIVVDEDSGAEALYNKVQQALERSGFDVTVAEVRNSSYALVPVDERLGDIFRDLDEATVTLEPGGGHPTQAYSNQLQRGTFLTTTAVEGGLRRSLDLLERADVPKDVARLSCHAAPTTQSTRHHFPVIAPKNAEREGGRIVPITANVTLPPQVIDDESDDEEDDYFDEGRLAPPEDYPPLPRAPPFAPPGAEAVPGPNEEFEAERMPYETMQVDHPVDPVQLTSYDNDWLVEHLTPRLRDFIISRFQPDLITEPKFVASIGKYVSAKYLQTSGSFVSVFMRPQTSLSSDPNTTMPVHYNLPKAQIVLFMRQAETHIEELEQHQEYLRASLRALRALLSTAAGGLSENDFVNVLLPMNYHAFTEAEGSMLEAEKPLLRLSSGKNTVIIIDTSGAVAEHLPYVKAAIKRTLHAHMCGKETFQLIRFTKTGEPRLWAQDMMAPTETAFECAETWIDRLESAESGNVLQAVRCALAFKSCDEIHIISSGTCFRPVEHDHLLSSLRYLNKREVAIHTSGVDPNPHSERLLRNIAESNHGDFTLKFFRDQGIGRANVIPSNHAKWTSWRTMLVNEKSRQLSDAFKQQKMSIGSQMKILDVMLREENQFEIAWRQEWSCAKKLLERVPECPDHEMVRELERGCSKTISARVGGGFVYQRRQVDIGMEKFFAHHSAVPWSVQGASVASGPKVPVTPVAQRRPNLPPASDQLPPSPDDELRYGPFNRQAAATNPWIPLPEPAPRQSRKVPQRQPRSRKSSRTASADRAAGASPAPRKSASRSGSASSMRRSASSRRGSPSPKTVTVSARVGGGFIYQTEGQPPPPRMPPSPRRGRMAPPPPSSGITVRIGSTKGRPCLPPSRVADPSPPSPPSAPPEVRIERIEALLQRAPQGRMSERTISARVGGGFVYDTFQERRPSPAFEEEPNTPVDLERRWSF